MVPSGDVPFFNDIISLIILPFLPNPLIYLSLSLSSQAPGSGYQLVGYQLVGFELSYLSQAVRCLLPARRVI